MTTRTVSYDQVVDLYGNPLLERLKTKIDLGEGKVRTNQEKANIDREIEKIDKQLQQSTEGIKSALVEQKEKLIAQRAGIDSGQKGPVGGSEKDEKFFTEVRKIRREYEQNYPPISQQDGRTSDARAEETRLYARGVMMQRIINKYIDEYPNEIRAIVQAADRQAFASRVEDAVIPEEYTELVQNKTTVAYAISIDPSSRDITSQGRTETEYVTNEQTGETFAVGGKAVSVIGHSKSKADARIFDIIDGDGQLNIRKLARTELLTGGKDFIEREDDERVVSDRTAANDMRAGFIPLYKNGELVSVDQRVNLLTNDKAVMMLAGNSVDQSQKVIAAFALRSAAVDFFFGSETRAGATDKLFADATDRSVQGGNHSVGFDVSVADTEKAKRGISAEAQAAETINELQNKLDRMAFREQCFLIDHYVPLIQNKFSETIFGPSNSYFPHFTAVDANPALFTARLCGTPSLKPLFEITPAEFSSLLPKVKLYKRFPGKDALRAYSGGVGNKSAIDSQVQAVLKKISSQKASNNEMIEVEIPFQINPTTQTINEIYANDKPRADGVGLRSFRFDFIGRNSFEVDKNIVCKLELFFRNLEDLEAGNSLARFIDLILFGVSKKSAKTAINKLKQRVDYYTPDNYSMKAVVGWEVPDPSMLPNGLIKNKELIELLKKNVLALNLTLTSHKINFDQDGSGTVEIDFIGALEAKANYNNLLRFEDPKLKEVGNLRQLRSELKVVEKKLAYRRSQFNETKSDPLGEGGTYYDDSFESRLQSARTSYANVSDRVNDLRTRINLLENARSTEAYSQFFKQLYDLPIYYIDLPEGDTFGDDKVTDPESVLGIVNNRMIASDELSSKIRMQLPLLQNIRSKIKQVTFELESHKDQLYRADGKKRGEGASAVAKDIQRQNQVNKEQGPDPATKVQKPKQIKQIDIDKKIYIGEPTAAGDRRIYFTYIGSVLKAGFELVSGNVLADINDLGFISQGAAESEREARLGKNRYLFGTIPFYDVREDKPALINITDLPIALNKVNAFWFNKVIRKNLTSYNLNTFIRDVISDLVIPFFSARCYGTYPDNLRIKSMFAPLEARGKGGQDRVPKVSRISNQVTAISKNPGVTFDNPTAKMYNYNYVYLSGAETLDLGGDVVQDADRGIYHFFIGLDRGLLKSAEFDRLDTAYQREMRSIGDENRVSAQLRQPYRAKLKTFGNTLFRPSMHCFVNPRVTGGSIKRENSLTYLMNLGGYGQIIKVSNVITPGSFETELDCVLAGMNVVENKSSGLRKLGPRPDIVDMRFNSAAATAAQYEKNHFDKELTKELLDPEKNPNTKKFEVEHLGKAAAGLDKSIKELEQALTDNPNLKEEDERMFNQLIKDLEKAKQRRKEHLDELNKYGDSRVEGEKNKEKIKTISVKVVTS